MALREPRVSCKNSLKKSNLPKDLIFGLIQIVEREREGGKERESQASLFDSRDFIGRNSAIRELKLIYVTRVACGYKNHQILPRSKVRDFMETKKMWCPVKSHHLR